MRKPLILLTAGAVLVILFGGLPAPSTPAADGSGTGDGAPPDAAAEAAFSPEIPRVWDVEAIEAMELPLAGAKFDVEPPPADFYYAIPPRTIYKSYPVYHPDHQPEGYLEWLRSQEPEIAFEPDDLATEEEWTAAGELVFQAPLGYNGLGRVERFQDPEWYEATGIPIAADGTLPYFRYVVREKGTIDVGEFSCATCHTRVMPDGQVIQGAQGNFPLERLDRMMMRSFSGEWDEERMARSSEGNRSYQRIRYGAPWVEPDPMARIDTMSYNDIADAFGVIPAGVQARFGASLFAPVQVPDLIGLEERRYFDRTGRIRHRGIGDLMRYAVMTTGVAGYFRYGHFVPSAGEELPEKPPEHLERYSDEQLYALALWLYSLEPPENPNPFDEKAARGKEIFEREECWRCHAPPLYSNNKLTPVDGFEVPEDHPEAQHIVPFSVGTDPTLALTTRRGTGLYKIPSLRGVWYRGPLSHDGSVATLEDWFDPSRHDDDYVPTGWIGWGVEHRAVPGHDIGLDLKPEEREALLAFLRTL
jgi:hypothetical protein